MKVKKTLTTFAFIKQENIGIIFDLEQLFSNFKGDNLISWKGSLSRKGEGV